MIKIENIQVFNLEGAIRGMRFPMQSWEKSDSYYNDVHFGSSSWSEYVIGPNDLALARKLVRAGSDHSKFMRQILVSMDITSSLYWWKEMDTYKVATVANSESTMHTLSKNPITRECFSFDKFNEEPQWCGMGMVNEPDIEFIQNESVRYCEFLRQKFLDTKDAQYWRALIQLLPSAWNQKRHWTGNYATLQKLVASRENHKLTEWHKFIATCNEQLPYFHELTKGE